MAEKILTLHPEGKTGVNISKAKYDTIRTAMLNGLADGEMPFGKLSKAVEANLTEPFDGSIGWYTTSVKLDLEARGEIVCDRRRSPQIVRLPEVA